MRIPIFKTALLFAFMSIQYMTYAASNSIDPLNSPGWEVMHDIMLDGDNVVFDNNVIVTVPDFAEDPLNVPVSVEVVGINQIEQIVVFADLNPIQKILGFKPIDIKPFISFRIKVEQSTPVRAAVKTSNGVWHVGGRWIEAAGGGCTAPSNSMVAGDWQQDLMKVSSRYWKGNETNRLRFRIMHPMDTGLAPGIPAFFIEQFSVINKSGRTLAELNTYQPISENPVFTFDLKRGSLDEQISLVGRDNNGNRLNATIR